MPRESLLKLTQAAAIGLGLLLALTIALSTGCVTPQPTPKTTPDPTAAMKPAEFLRSRSNLPTHTPAATTPPYDIPHGRLLAYGDHVGEFGGIHYEGGDPRGTMHFYMTEGNFDPALIPEARERFDRFYRHVPDQKIVVHKAQYPWSRLEEWEDTISKAKAGNNTLGIYSWGVSQGDRLITLNAAPMRGNRGRIEAIIATTDVPRDAIQVSIGCDRARAELTAEKVGPNFKDTFAYSVEAQPRARHGETVDLKLIIRNQTSEPAHIYGGRNSFDFVISNESGENVWHWQCGKVTTLVLRSQWVSPDKPLEFTGDWEQIDMKGHPVPPGIYHIRGALDMDYPERLVTDPITIEILPP